MDPQRTYVRVAEFVLPNSCAVPARQENGMGYVVNWHVPIDDTHHWKFVIYFNWEHPLDSMAMRKDRFAYIDSEYMPLRNRQNRYLQDRSTLETQTYTGMGYDFTRTMCGPSRGRGQFKINPRSTWRRLIYRWRCPGSFCSRRSRPSALAGCRHILT